MLTSRRRTPSKGFNAFWIIASALAVTLLSGSLPPPVYGAPAKLDPIAVSLPNESAEGLSTGTGIAGSSSGETTSVDVDHAQLVELHSHSQQQEESVHSPRIAQAESINSNGIPEYLLDLNDPDIGGPVDYVPNKYDMSLSVIAWDLLPPHEKDEAKEQNPPKHQDSETHNTKVSLTTAVNNLNSPVTDGKVGIIDLNQHAAYTPNNAGNNQLSNNQESETYNDYDEKTKAGVIGTRTNGGRPNANNFGNNAQHVDTSPKKNTNNFNTRGNVYFSSTSPRSASIRTTQPTTTTTSRPTTTTTLRTTTTTTPRPTTTTTTRRPTTTTTRPTTAATRAATTTSEPLDPSTFYKLEAGDSYTLPPWLADVDDPELDVAVTFVVPTDNNEYNHTIEQDLEPPLEPFVDLNNINLPAPAEHTTQQPPTTTTTTRRHSTTTATTKRATTTTTTRRPTASTAKAHWVRADPTTPTPTPRATLLFDNNFAFNNDPSISSTNTQTSTASTFTTARPTTKPNYSHQQSSNTPTVIADLISSAESDAALGSQNNNIKFRQENPFLSNRNTGAYNTQPKPFSKVPETTSTTTTTTTPAPLVEANPFDAAIPSWLQDFDYPDLGPGVPFKPDDNAYSPDNAAAAPADTLPIDDLLPPSESEDQATDNNPSKQHAFVTSSPASFNTFRSPQTFAHQQPTSTSTSSSATFPSKVTLPLPSIQQTIQNRNAAVTQPPVVFIPPTSVEDGDADTNANTKVPTNENTQKSPPSIFNKHFTAPFEPTNPLATNEAAATVADQVTPFPPIKTSFTKSDDGKVITSNVFQSSQKPSGFGGTQTKDFDASQINQFSASSIGSNSIQSSTASFSKTSTPSGDVTLSSAVVTSAAGSKYTGSFGGAPGVLSNSNGLAAVQSYRPINNDSAFSTVKPAQTERQNAIATNAFGGFLNRGGISNVQTQANAPADVKYRGKFGGPPGVYAPYDNLDG